MDLHSIRPGRSRACDAPAEKPRMTYITYIRLLFSAHNGQSGYSRSGPNLPPIRCGKFMDPCHGGSIHHQPFSGLAQPACDQADFFQLMADRFCAIDEALVTGLCNAVDFRRDLADPDLSLALAAKTEGRLENDSLDAGRAVCVSLVLNRREQRDKLRLKLRRVHDAGAQRLRDRARVGRQCKSIEVGVVDPDEIFER